MATMIALNSSPEVMHYFPSVMSIEETIAMMGRIQKHFMDWGYGLWAAELKATQECIGFIGLAHPRFESSFTPCVEVGWRILPFAWNKGLATEGAKACLRFAFEVLNLPEVYSWTAEVNVPSERVMQKIGLRQLESFNHPNMPEGHILCKHVKYYLSNTEYANSLRG